MAFDLEGNRQPVPNVQNASIFLAGPHQHARPFGRETLQQQPRVFVRAMLAPHHAEDAQLGKIRLPPNDLLYAVVFLQREVVFLNELRSDGRVFRH